jgi:hypothetical protein
MKSLCDGSFLLLKSVNTRLPLFFSALSCATSLRFFLLDLVNYRVDY